MSSTKRRSFLARSAALVAVPTVAMLAGGTLTGQASAATLADSAPVPPSALPLTDRHLTKREKENLAVVLRAYHDGEGDSLDPQGSCATARSRCSTATSLLPPCSRS